MDENLDTPSKSYLKIRDAIDGLLEFYCYYYPESKLTGITDLKRFVHGYVDTCFDAIEKEYKDAIQRKIVKIDFTDS